MIPYPSTAELIPDVIRARLPAFLCEEIAERYDTLGEKYLTGFTHTDGRYINGCMYNSSTQDAIEEIVDAVFNTLVWLFKCRLGLDNRQENAWLILNGLIEVYALLKAERIVEIEEAESAITRA